MVTALAGVCDVPAALNKSTSFDGKAVSSPKVSLGDVRDAPIRLIQNCRVRPDSDAIRVY